MADDELIAQMLGIILEGVQDGGQRTIERLYKKYDGHVPQHTLIRLDTTIQRILDDLLVIVDTPLVRGPHFIMLFAAVAHGTSGIPAGDIELAAMPSQDDTVLSDVMLAQANLGTLSDVIQMDEREVPERFFAFKYASAGTTQRIRSRKPRFLTLYRALLPKPL